MTIDLQKRPAGYSVVVDDEEVQFCHTIAEAFLWIAREFHMAAMDELQERINHLEAGASSS